MIREPGYYLCSICFLASETQVECHGHWMIRCDALDAGDERRRPEMGPRGRLKTRAPRWFTEALRQYRIDAGL
jgi:hypothetical protein